MQCCLEPLGQYCIGFWPVQCYPKSIKRTLHSICSYTKLSGASWTTLHRVSSCAIFPRVLRQICRGFFLMHCCLEPRWYYCIRFWPVQSCPKSIEANLQRIFSYAMLSGASRTTLHRVLTCAILSQEY